MNRSTISDAKFPSPGKIICLLLLALFCIETILMYALPYLSRPDNSPYLDLILDASLLTLLFAPVLYRFIFKPLRDIAVFQKSLTENLLRHLVDGVVIFDESLTVRSFNGAAERIFGYSAPEIVGTELKLILGESVVDAIAALLKSCQGELAPEQAIRETTANRRDGTEVPIDLSLSRVQLRGSWMWLGIIRDISARKREEEAAKQTLSLLTATLESTADGIMLRDLDGKVIISNKRFDEMWHIPPQVSRSHNDQLMRAYVLDQLKDPQAFVELTENQYVAPDQEGCQLLSFKDGRVYERFSAPQIIDGRVVGRVICCRDVTEQKNLEHQLRHAQKMEALGTLAGGVAHDFNNILTVIMGFCSLASGNLEAGSPLKRNLDQIMTASDRALTLTNSLLAYSRKQPMRPVPLDLNGSIRNTEKFLARLIGEEIELATRLCQERLVVLADRGQFEQVLMNLAANARDAMQRRGSLIIATGKLHLDQDFVRLHGYGRPGSFAIISVSDTGSGMDQATRDKIFEPFFTTKEVGQGTGLGLSIVYGIVKQHDGYINVYSEPGKGTNFNIYLPVIEGAEEVPDVLQQQPAGGTETILLAEDDAGVRALMKSVLSGSGYRVIEATDGADAVEKFLANRERVDLLVLDVVMPKKNGKEALLEICVFDPKVKAIFTSGYTADIMDKNGLVEEGGHLITKPLLPNQLLGKVREVLDSNRG